jgi:hypothetical protein
VKPTLLKAKQRIRPTDGYQHQLEERERDSIQKLERKGQNSIYQCTGLLVQIAPEET